jgi:hypothetical protein
MTAVGALRRPDVPATRTGVKARDPSLQPPSVASPITSSRRPQTTLKEGTYLRLWVSGISCVVRIRPWSCRACFTLRSAALMGVTPLSGRIEGGRRLRRW